MGKEEQVTEDDDFEYIDRESFENIILTAEKMLSKLFGASTDMELFQRFMGCMVMYYVGMLFSLGALLWLLTIGAFAVPPLYAQNQDLVDGLVGQGKDAFSTYTNMAMKFIPRAQSAKSDKQD